MEKYSADDIRPVAIPEWRQETSGEWSRVWNIRFSGPIKQTAEEVLQCLREPQIRFDVQIDSDKSGMSLTTVTVADPLSAEMFLLAPYRVLRFIDTSIGRIESVQGQPRDWWTPFKY